MKENLYNFLLAALPVILMIAGWIGQKISVFLTTKIGETNFNKALRYAKTIVCSIEQTMGSGNGAAKKKAVVDLLAQKLNKYLTADEINHLVEAAVFEINQGKLLPIDSSSAQLVPIDTATSDKEDAQQITSQQPDPVAGVNQSNSGQQPTSQFTDEQINYIANAVAQATVSAISTTQNGISQAVVV